MDANQVLNDKVLVDLPTSLEDASRLPPDWEARMKMEQAAREQEEEMRKALESDRDLFGKYITDAALEGAGLAVSPGISTECTQSCVQSPLSFPPFVRSRLGRGALHVTRFISKMEDRFRVHFAFSPTCRLLSSSAQCPAQNLADSFDAGGALTPTALELSKENGKLRETKIGSEPRDKRPRTTREAVKKVDKTMLNTSLVTSPASMVELEDEMRAEVKGDVEKVTLQKMSMKQTYEATTMSEQEERRLKGEKQATCSFHVPERGKGEDATEWKDRGAEGQVRKPMGKGPYENTQTVTQEDQENTSLTNKPPLSTPLHNHGPSIFPVTPLHAPRPSQPPFSSISLLCNVVACAYAQNEITSIGIPPPLARLLQKAVSLRRRQFLPLRKQLFRPGSKEEKAEDVTARKGVDPISSCDSNLKLRCADVSSHNVSNCSKAQNPDSRSGSNNGDTSIAAHPKTDWTQDTKQIHQQQNEEPKKKEQEKVPQGETQNARIENNVHGKPTQTDFEPEEQKEKLSHYQLMSREAEGQVPAETNNIKQTYKSEDSRPPCLEQLSTPRQREQSRCHCRPAPIQKALRRPPIIPGLSLKQLMLRYPPPVSIKQLRIKGGRL